MVKYGTPIYMMEQEGFRLYERFIPQICGEKWIYRTKTSTIVCVCEETVDFKVVAGETFFCPFGYLDLLENGNFQRMYTEYHPRQI